MKNKRMVNKKNTTRWTFKKIKEKEAIAIKRKKTKIDNALGKKSIRNKNNKENLDKEMTGKETSKDKGTRKNKRKSTKRTDPNLDQDRNILIDSMIAKDSIKDD